MNPRIRCAKLGPIFDLYLSPTPRVSSPPNPNGHNNQDTENQKLGIGKPKKAGSKISYCRFCGIRARYLDGFTPGNLTGC